MPERETFRGYLEAVEAQIRWKRARPVVALELEQHLEDQRDALTEEGASPEEAERRTLLDMGDPVAVGTAFDRVHRPQPSWGMLALVWLSCCVWLGWQAWSYPPYNGRIELSALVLLLGVGVMAAVYFADYTMFGKNPLLLAVSGTVIAALAAQAQFFDNYYSVIYIVLLLPMTTALAIYALRGKGYGGLAICCALAAAQLFPAFVYETELLRALCPPLVCNTILLGAAVGRGWFGKRKWISAGIILAFALVSAGGLFALSVWNHRWDELLTFTKEFYQREYAVQRRDWFFQAANLFGMADLPEHLAENLRDPFANGSSIYFFDWVILRWGWAAFAAVQLPVLGLLAWGWRRVKQQTAVLGRLLGETALLLLTYQTVAALLSLLMELMGLFPFSLEFAKYPYPFLAQGGTALVLDFALLGLLLSVFRNGSIVRDDEAGNSRILKRRTKAETAVLPN